MRQPWPLFPLMNHLRRTRAGSESRRCFAYRSRFLVWQTVLMDFNPDTWGTIGQWASALITGSAFFATFYVIRRDAAVRRYAQARKVAYYVKVIEPSKYEPVGTIADLEYIVRNISDEPIYGLAYFYHPGRRVVRGQEVVLPGEEVIYRRQGAEDIGREVGTPRIWFRDNSGHFWNRSIDGFLRRGGGAISNVKRIRAPR